MSSILSSQAVVLAAVSCTVILLAAFRHHKFTHTPPRPCLPSDGKRKEKRVRFAEDVVEPSGDGVEFRKRHRKLGTNPSPISSSSCSDGGRRAVRGGEKEGDFTGMPANRVALYNGMLRDRVAHRSGYSC